MSENLVVGLLYSKQLKSEKGTFQKFLFKSEEGKTYQVHLTKKLSAKITAENWELPQKVTLDDCDYFVKPRKWESGGKSGVSYDLVISSVTAHEKGEFPSLHLRDIEIAD